MKRNTKIMLSSLAVIAGTVGMTVGATTALFTSNAETDVTIQAGKVNVSMEIKNLVLYSYEYNEATGVYDSVKREATPNMFYNGGTAEVANSVLTLDRISPMDRVEFDIAFTNASNIDILYRMSKEIITDNGLADALDIKFDDTTVFDGFTEYTQWTLLEQGAPLTGYHVSIELPEEAGNEFQEKTCSLKFGIEAVQANAHVTNVLNDPTADLIILTKNDLKRFAKLVDEGQVPTNAKVLLGADIDLGNEPWTPIGSSEGKFFTGTFDGCGHTISNLKINSGNKYTGLFGYTGNATIKNLILKNVDIKSVGHWVGAAVGYMYSGYAENVNVTGSVKIDAQEQTDGSYYVGGIIGKTEGMNGSELKVVADAGSYIDGAYYVGGIIGFQGNTGAQKFDKCVVKGLTIKSASDSYDGYGAGGIMGLAQNNNIISNCDIDVTIYNGGALTGGYGADVSFLNNIGKATIDGDYACEDLGGGKRFEDSSLVLDSNNIIVTNNVGSVDYSFDSSTMKIMKKLGTKTPVEANESDLEQFAGRMFVKNGAAYELVEKEKTMAQLIGALPENGTLDLVLVKGEYKLGGSNNKPVTVNLHGYVTSDNKKTATILTYSGTDGSATYVTMSNVSLVVDNLNCKGTTTGGWYRGIQPATVEYHYCDFTGGTTNYADTANYYNCNFDSTNINNGGKADYAVYCYNSHSKFVDCNFVSAGKAVKVYSEGNKVDNLFYFENCTFTIGTDLLTPKDGKAAIEIDSRYQTDVNKYVIQTKNCSQSGYDRGLAADSNTKSTIVNLPLD